MEHGSELLVEFLVKDAGGWKDGGFDEGPIVATPARKDFVGCFVDAVAHWVMFEFGTLLFGKAELT